MDDCATLPDATRAPSARVAWGPAALRCWTVFARELASTIRQPTTHVLHVVFVLVAAAAVTRPWDWAWPDNTQGNGPSHTVLLQHSVVTSLFLAELLLVSFAAPLLTTMIVVEERERRTLDLLLITPLSGREIILAKFSARMFHLLVLVALFTPVFLASLALDRSSVGTLLAHQSLVVTSAVWTGAVGLFFSATAYRGRQAVIRTGSFLLLQTAALPILVSWFAAGGDEELNSCLLSPITISLVRLMTWYPGKPDLLASWPFAAAFYLAGSAGLLAAAVLFFRGPSPEVGPADANPARVYWPVPPVRMACLRLEPHVYWPDSFPHEEFDRPRSGDVARQDLDPISWCCVAALWAAAVCIALLFLLSEHGWRAWQKRSWLLPLGVLAAAGIRCVKLWRGPHVGFALRWLEGALRGPIAPSRTALLEFTWAAFVLSVVSSATVCFRFKFPSRVIEDEFGLALSVEVGVLIALSALGVGIPACRAVQSGRFELLRMAPVSPARLLAARCHRTIMEACPFVGLVLLHLFDHLRQNERVPEWPILFFAGTLVSILSAHGFLALYLSLRLRRLPVVLGMHVALAIVFCGIVPMLFGAFDTSGRAAESWFASSLREAAHAVNPFALFIGLDAALRGLGYSGGAIPRCLWTGLVAHAAMALGLATWTLFRFDRLVRGKA
ncbi:MAG: ABC transporter permease [Planctomycetes bacterium]|nr:ABC transporter permease [Planctomycetota bacterium]